MATTDNDREAARLLIHTALARLSDQLEGHPDPLLLFVPGEELVLFRGTLEAMDRTLRDGSEPRPALLSSGMAKTVMYRWPFSALGVAIIRCVKAFRECFENQRGEPMGAERCRLKHRLARELSPGREQGHDGDRHEQK